MAETNNLHVPIRTQQVDLNRIVIAVGTTGTGKSTIINMLLNNDVSRDALTGPAAVGETMDPVTKDSKWYVNPKHSRIFTDTIGLGDPQMIELGVVANIKRMFKSFQLGVHCILLVVKYGRFSKEDRMNILAMNKIFDSRWIDSCVLVVTHYDGETDDDSLAKALEKWVGIEKKVEETEPARTVLQHAINSIKAAGAAIEDILAEDDEMVEFRILINKLAGRIVFADNSMGRHFESNANVRQQTLTKLNNYIDQLGKQVVGPAPETLLERIRAILEIYFGFYKIRQAKERITNAWKFICDKATSGSCCPVCLEPMFAPDMVVPNCRCRNIFHIKCLTEWMTKGAGNTCPMCRDTVTVIQRLNFTFIPSN